jgi:sugar phosphate isomerase/epimerase
MVYPFPPRPENAIEDAFRELARRWTPVLDYAAENDVALAFELHPATDLFDGRTWERFLDRVNGHAAACLNYDPSHLYLQCIDYVEFIDFYAERIRGFHVKDAELRSDGRAGVLSSYETWRDRAGRFRTPGDGEIDFTKVFRALSEYGFDGWAVLEWECPVKTGQQGASEGALFIARQMALASEASVDDELSGLLEEGGPVGG